MPAKYPTNHQSGRPVSPATPERIQKILARAGLGSRRSLEAAIKAGAIRINGKVCELGSSLAEDDRVEFNNRHYRVITSTQPQQTLLYNKPVGELTTQRDPEGRKTVFDRLPKPDHGRWVAIGRLDINTSGLLILTTDGELANAMMHPSSQVDREYACRVFGQVSQAQLQALRDGVELDDGPARFNDISVAGGGESNQWYQVTIMEGRNREVRRLWETQGVEVSRLQRVRYGAAFLPKGLLRGQWHWLSERNHKVLREDVKLPSHTKVLTLQAEKPNRRSQNNTSNKQQRTNSKAYTARKKNTRKSDERPSHTKKGQAKTLSLHKKHR